MVRSKYRSEGLLISEERETWECFMVLCDRELKLSWHSTVGWYAIATRPFHVEAMSGTDMGRARQAVPLCIS